MGAQALAAAWQGEVQAKAQAKAHRWACTVCVLGLWQLSACLVHVWQPSCLPWGCLPQPDLGLWGIRPMGNQAYGELGQGRSSGSSGAGGGAGQGLQVGMEGSCFGVSDGPFGAWHGHEQWGRGFPCCMATWLIFFLWLAPAL